MFEIALPPFGLLAMVIVSFLASPPTPTMVCQEVWTFVTANWWWLVYLGGRALSAVRDRVDGLAQDAGARGGSCLEWAAAG
jgi:hypothetical protein